MSRFRLLPVILLPLALAGCETLGLSDPDPAQVVEATPACPVTAVLSDAVTVTKVKPGTPTSQAPNPANVLYTAEMSQARLTCNYDRIANTLSVDVNFAIRATRGAGANGADPALDYFVAIVDVDNNVLAKRTFQSRPNLGSQASGTFQETINNFAVPLEMDKRPIDYEILTGFQLTPDELALNRAPKPLPQARR
jgi:hypothetical protein